MGIATSGSVARHRCSASCCLALFTPSLGELALQFGAFEFFWLALFGVLMSGSLTGNDPLKGWLTGFAGMFATLIGQDGIHAHDRFTFGIRDLAGGISLVPALVGAFGFAELLTVLSRAARARRSIESVRLGDPEASRRRAVLADDPALGRHRHRSSASCPASARTSRRGRRTPPPSARARRRRSSARARSRA